MRAFPFYNTLDHQSRNTSQCEAACDYGQPVPLNSIPPFQINTGLEAVTVVSWKIFCADGQEYIDLAGSIAGSLISHATTSAGIFLTYTGGELSISLPCGSYYVYVLTDSQSWYSEVFKVIEFDDNSLSTPTDLPLFTAWRYYDDVNKSERFQKQCEAVCNYYLITGNDALPPFMFRVPHTTDVVNLWQLESIDGDCVHVLDHAVITKVQKGAWDYVYYSGDDIADLPCGSFVSNVQIGANDYYGEPIKVVNQALNNAFSDYLQTDSGVFLHTDDGIQIEVD